MPCSPQKHIKTILAYQHNNFGLPVFYDFTDKIKVIKLKSTNIPAFKNHYLNARYKPVSPEEGEVVAGGGRAGAARPFHDDTSDEDTAAASFVTPYSDNPKGELRLLISTD